MTDPIRSWAKRYAEELEKRPQPRSLAGQRARLLLTHRAPKTRGIPIKAYLTVAGFGSVVALVFALAYGGGKEVEAQVRPQLAGMDVAPGSPIVAARTQQELLFPGGSRVIWKESSQGTLSKYSQEAVELTLDSGSVELDVTHQAGKTWLVRAGDFRVYVVGTAFTVAHDRDSGAVEVGVIRGRVRVEGPRIGDGRLTLKPGERFVWNPEVAEASTDTQDAEARVDRAAQVDITEQMEPDAESPNALIGAKKNNSPSWQQLAQEGKYKLAVEEVERRGVGAAIEKANADEKVLLGNAARYSGRVALAKRAYKSARTTPGPAATLAAYYLAKTSLDASSNSTEAIGWLRIYLKEGQNSELASSARARLMNLLDASGDRAGAISIAKQYLALHPNGPQAQAAQKLIEGP